MLVPLLLVFLLQAPATPEVEPPPTPPTIEVYPRFSQAPATIKITVRLDPHSTNRKMCIGYDGAQERSSCWQLDGKSRRTTEQWYRDLPGGEYFAWVRVLRADGSSQQAQTTFQVLSAVSDPN